MTFKKIILAIAIVSNAYTSENTTDEFDSGIQRLKEKNEKVLASIEHNNKAIYFLYKKLADRTSSLENALPAKTLDGARIIQNELAEIKSEMEDIKKLDSDATSTNEYQYRHIYSNENEIYKIERQKIAAELKPERVEDLLRALPASSDAQVLNAADILAAYFSTDKEPQKKILERFKNQIKQDIQNGSLASLVAFAQIYDNFYKYISENLFDFLLKGESREIAERSINDFYLSYARKTGLNAICLELLRNIRSQIDELAKKGHDISELYAKFQKIISSFNQVPIEQFYQQITAFAEETAAFDQKWHYWIKPVQRALQLTYKKWHSYWYREEETEKNALFLADYLTLYHMTKDAALSGLLYESKTQNLSKDAEEIAKQRIEKNFSVGLLKKRSEYFEDISWKGYVQTKKTTTSQNVVFLPQVEKSMTIDGKEIQYGEMRSEAPPKVIVIGVYTGHSISKGCGSTIVIPFDYPGVFLNIKNVGDCESDVAHSGQFNESNFANTHVIYMQRVSDFIKEYKRQNPQIADLPVFLKGVSFGGLFVTSYALLQSLTPDELQTVYKPYVAAAYASIKRSLEPVQGFISGEGGLLNIREIMQNTTDLSRIKVPIYIAQNMNDDRVLASEVLHYIKQINQDVLFLDLNKMSPYSGLGLDIDKPIPKKRNTTLSKFQSSAYGHTEYFTALPHFIDKVIKGELNQSDFSKVQRDIALRDYQDFGQDPNHRLKQQYLANQDLLQSIIEERKTKGLPQLSKEAFDEIRLRDLPGTTAADKEAVYQDLKRQMTKTHLWQSLAKQAVRDQRTPAK